MFLFESTNTKQIREHIRKRNHEGDTEKIDVQTMLPRGFGSPLLPQPCSAWFCSFIPVPVSSKQRHYKVGTVANHACTAHCAKHGTLHGDFE